jgi:hypothetical protein
MLGGCHCDPSRGKCDISLSGYLKVDRPQSNRWAVRPDLDGEFNFTVWCQKAQRTLRV